MHASNTRALLPLAATCSRTFRAVDRGITADSTMMSVSVDPRAPQNIACAARDGQVFRSTDDGANWSSHPLPDKALEVRAIAAG